MVGQYKYCMTPKNIDNNAIQELLNNGRSNKEISDLLNISSSTVTYYRKKFDKNLTVKRYNWTEIQEAHNNGASYTELKKLYGVTKRAIQMAKLRGDFETRQIPRMSPEQAKIRKRVRDREAWMRYHSAKKYQTPADENIKALQDFYANCPVGYEVDHIIPISKGGLHTLSNLQYLTISENRSKGNKIL